MLPFRGKRRVLCKNADEGGVGIPNHGSDLPAPKGPSVTPYPQLRIERLPSAHCSDARN